MLRSLCLGLAAFTVEGANWDSYTTALKALNWTAVDEAISSALTTPNAAWKADYGNYGPLVIRLAWHCAGAYRKSDGRGGCDGARIRFFPEANWPDNANLDKARRVLEPIKAQFGEGLSYGDLYIRAGTLAIKNMGGPVLGFCAGRFDDVSGAASFALGPDAEQTANYPCIVQGDCKEDSGLGPTTVGLIYVNPEGPQGNGVAADSAPQIRDTFARMGMNDRETVALVGGGHSFGKSHGACNLPNASGNPPDWVGVCNSGPITGQGIDTSTSGFEGPWTSTPTTWSNQYFQNLVNFTWQRQTGPGGHFQYQNASALRAPQVDGNGTVALAMLNADVSLTTDGNYTLLLNEFANNKATLEDVFSRAWYKLVTRDMGPRARCFSTAPSMPLPPQQDFQHDLGTPNVANLPNFAVVKADLATFVNSKNGRSWVAEFAQLAWQCASTYRQTDYSGGCNGARIRFPPESQWPANLALNSSGLLAMLDGVRTKYPGLSWADAIVLAGQVAIEKATGATLSFCGGRMDAVNGDASAELSPVNWTNKVSQLKEQAFRWGVSLDEVVALQAIPRVGSTVSGTALFTQIVGTDSTGLTDTDLAIRNDNALKAIAQTYASNATKLAVTLGVAWTKVVNADFFIGWNGLECPKALLAEAPAYSSAPISALAGVATVVSILSLMLV